MYAFIYARVQQPQHAAACGLPRTIANCERARARADLELIRLAFINAHLAVRVHIVHIIRRCAVCTRAFA